MNPQPITITFLSRSHTIEPYDAEGLEYRLKVNDQLELRLYRLNRGWMARLDVACFDTYTQSHRSKTAQAAVDEIERELVPVTAALSPALAGILFAINSLAFAARDIDAEHTVDSHADSLPLRYLQSQAALGQILQLCQRLTVSESEPPSCDEPTVEMSREMLAEALAGS